MTLSTSLFVLFALMISVFLSARHQQQKRREKQRNFIQTYAFPDTLRYKLRASYPQLTEAQIGAVLEALRDWFLLLQAHPHTKFGMPSKVVDDAWHEFILITRQYQAFCESAFGRYLHHEPNEIRTSSATPGPERLHDAALARTFAVGGGAVLGGAALFAIDRALAIPGGFEYSAAKLNDLREYERYAQQQSGGGGGCAGYTAGADSGDGGADGGGCSGGGCGGGCGS